MIDAESSFRASTGVVDKLQQILQRIAANDGNMVAKEIWREEDIKRCVYLNIRSIRRFPDCHSSQQVTSSPNRHTRSMT